MSVKFTPLSVLKAKGLLKKGKFNFDIGEPNPAAMKAVFGYMQAAFGRIKDTEWFEETLQYEMQSGANSVRKQVASFLTRQYAHSVVKEDIYMKQPNGFAEKGKETLVCRLKRSIYGLKQSA